MPKTLLAAVLWLWLVLLVGARVVDAAQPDWLLLNTARFSVVSQLDEKATRSWTAEFDQFIGTLQQLFPVDESLLSPLTVVLFADQRKFRPYRMQTESGQVQQLAGFFGKVGNWSVIGVPRASDLDQTRNTILHEAVHWFLSADSTPRPLWFEEGLAENFATFRTKGDKVQWGVPIPDHVDYLNIAGLLPMERFLRLSQDEVMHGEGASYYPQAWAFVHYLMFGKGPAGRASLARFLEELTTGSVETAFAAAFAQTYAALDNDLRTYLQVGEYVIAEVPAIDSHADVELQAAAADQVEFALARLALAGGNATLAREHAVKVTELAPERPEGHEVLALSYLQDRNMDQARVSLRQAMERGTKDASVYEVKALILIADYAKSGYPDERFSPAQAAEVAEVLMRAITLEPRKRALYQLFVTALACVADIDDRHRQIIAFGAKLFPHDPTLKTGQALLAREDGNLAAAMQHLAGAVHAAQRKDSDIAYYQVIWLRQMLRERIMDDVLGSRFEAALAAIDSALPGIVLTDKQQTVIDEERQYVSVRERIAGAIALAEGGDFQGAENLLAAIQSDEQIRQNAKWGLSRELEMLQRDRHAIQQIEAARAASKAGDKSAAAAMLKELTKTGNYHRFVIDAIRQELELLAWQQ